MKKLCIAVLLLMLPVFSALAETDGEFWTLRDDLYYHAYEHCGHADGMVSISSVASMAFGKYPCPICVPTEDDASEVQAVTRGGTIVLRFSDEYLYSFDVEGVFGFNSGEEYSENAAWDALGEHLHGKRLLNFLSDYAENGSAEGISRKPDVLCTEGELMMNRRHIGGYWYIAIRPEIKFDSSWEMYWRIDEYDISMDAEQVFSEYFNRQTLEEHKLISIQSLSGDSASFTKDYGEIELQIFDGLDAHIGLIYEKNADEDFLEDVEVRINADAAFTANGYMNGSRAVYVFILTDAEANAIENEDASVSLERKSIIETADFMDSDYAAVRRGSGNMGIIDRDGNFVVAADYASIMRPSESSYRITGQRPFLLTEQSGTIIILNGDTLEIIAEIEKSENSRYLSAEYMNPAVFKIRSQYGMGIYSLKDGSELYSVPFGSDGNYIDNISDIDGYFRVLADGEPTCLVMNKGYLIDSESYLIDIDGFKRCSESFHCITPLIWKDGKGIFLVEKHNCTQLASSFGGETMSCFEYGSVYDGSAYGETWRCGLIDEKGGIVASVVYTSIEVLSENEIRLGNADGDYETIELFA